MTYDDHILYHGATSIVCEPLTHVGRPDLDFGPGFYVTNDKEQAVRWAQTKAGRTKNRKAVLNVFHFDQDRFDCDKKFNLRIFTEYNIEWLNFIAYSRKGQKPWNEFDWIEGGIANDSVISTVDAYIDGMMPAEMAIGRLVNEKLKHQICIRNQVIIDNYISFVESVDL